MLQRIKLSVGTTIMNWRLRHRTGGTLAGTSSPSDVTPTEAHRMPNYDGISNWPLGLIEEGLDSKR